MKPTIISPKAHNWVDQGHPPDRVLRRVLAFVLERHDESDAEFLDHHARTIVGMVAADASEVQVANYVRSLAAAESEARLAGIALWHIAKAALVRDFAERVLQGDVPVNAPTPDSFSHWMATQLLSPEELARFERERREGDE